MIKQSSFLIRELQRQRSHFSLLHSTRSIFAFSQENSFESLNLHPDLLKNLTKLGYTSMTEIQKLSLQHLLSGKNTALLSESGSGKSLAYLIPILDHLLKTKSSSASEPDPKKPSGAVIISATKELACQGYAHFRKLDPTNALSANRLGSIVHLSGIVQFLSENNDSNDLSAISQICVTESTVWSKIDALFTTPLQFDDITATKEKLNRLDINPKFIVIDEFDIMFSDKTFANAMRNILRRYAAKYKSSFGLVNAERQFILAGSNIPAQIDNLDTRTTLQSWFSDLKFFETADFQTVPKDIIHEVINIPESYTLRQEVELLAEAIRLAGEKKILVFFDASKTLMDVHDLLVDKKINCFEYHASKTTEERMAAIAGFRRAKKGVLLSTDLGSRGLDFGDVEIVIQFVFASNLISLLNRIGRVRRMGSKAAVVSFVREEDEPLLNEYDRLKATGEKYKPEQLLRRKKIASQSRQRLKGPSTDSEDE